MGVEENEETSLDKSVAIRDNDEQLIPWMPNRSKSLYDRSGDATHGRLALKAYQQNLYLEYYY